MARKVPKLENRKAVLFAEVEWAEVEKGIQSLGNFWAGRACASPGEHPGPKLWQHHGQQTWPQAPAQIHTRSSPAGCPVRPNPQVLLASLLPDPASETSVWDEGPIFCLPHTLYPSSLSLDPDPKSGWPTGKGVPFPSSCPSLSALDSLCRPEASRCRWLCRDRNRAPLSFPERL